MNTTHSKITPLSPAVGTRPRTVTILGATGTIGCNALDLIANSNGKLRTTVLTAQNNAEKLIMQAREHQPDIVVIGNEAKYNIVKDALSDTQIQVMAGEQALQEAATYDADIVLSGIVGSAALLPTLAALKSGTTVALANKECLVCAGELVMQTAAAHGATILPVDSEHNAAFQAMGNTEQDSIEKIILTASGGPFRNFTREQMAHVTVEDATNHPNWSMGPKISVDSATMMNKGLELIEARWLFNLSPDKLGVLVHPESVIHSLVQFTDGSMVAGLSTPDMRVPLAHALGWPKRLQTNTKRLDLAAISTLHFEAPDDTKFPALKLANEVLQKGGSAGAILNAANEVAVKAFLQGRIKFSNIINIVSDILVQVSVVYNQDLDAILALDTHVRQLAEACTAKYN